jgi:hypothetical protein
MDAGGTATTECPPKRRGSEWKHESPDFSRGENQLWRESALSTDLSPLARVCWNLARIYDSRDYGVMAKVLSKARFFELAISEYF